MRPSVGRTQRIGLWFATVSLLCATLVGLAWRCYGNAEAKIKATLNSGAQGLERKDFWAVMRCVAPHYRDGGGLTYRDIQQMVLSWCRNRNAQLWLTVQPQRVQLLNFWQATATVQVQGTAMVDAVTVPIGPMTVTLHLERTWWGQWRVTRSDGWQQDTGIQRLRSEYLGE